MEIGDPIDTQEETGPSSSRAELQGLLAGLRDLRNGEFKVRIPDSANPLMAQIVDAFNGVAERNERLASEVTRVAKEVGTEGKLGSQAHVPGAAGTWKDLTDNVNTLTGNLTSQVRTIADELERAMGVRNRFYASMSHELRTPINAVIGYSTLLIDNIYGPLNDKQREGLQRTLKAARHLLELVNDVLDLSKIEAGKIELELQPVNIALLIEDLFVTVRPLADEYGSQLSFRHSSDSLTITTDPRRVRQILLNLLSNAIKFGRKQPIEVRCTPAADGGVSISVIDHGEGISEADKTRVFEEFVQVSPTQQPGTGLGLPISRRLASLLEGSLELESVLGQGSTFRLILPRESTPRAINLDELSAATAT